MKDIKVTEEFVGLGEKITKCQTGEFRADCETREHRELVRQSCQCSPANIRSYYGSSVRHYINQSGPLSLVESFKVLKYFHGVATPPLLCHNEPILDQDLLP